MLVQSRNIISAMIIATASLLSLCIAQAQETPAKVDKIAALLPQSIQDAGVLRIAIPNVGKPLSYQEGSVLKGMDPDLANAVAAVLGLKPEVTFIPFTAALVGLQANRFDISYGEFYVTDERLQVADFVTNWQDFSSFLVTKSGDYKPSQLDDICGHIVGAMAGSAEMEIIKTAASKCEGNTTTISAFPATNEAVLSLKSGRVDAVLFGRGRAQEAIDLDSSFDASGEIGGGPTATAVARTENSAKLLEAIKAAYEHLIESGDYMKILEKNNTAYGAARTATIYTENSTPPKYGF